MPVELATYVAIPLVVRSEAGRLHIRYKVGPRTVDDGRCGIDENWVAASIQDVENAEEILLCDFCFPVTVTE